MESPNVPDKFRLKTLAELEEEDGITKDVDDWDPDRYDPTHGGFYKMIDSFGTKKMFAKMRKAYDKAAKRWRDKK